jgi:hypothetical protein
MDDSLRTFKLMWPMCDREEAGTVGIGDAASNQHERSTRSLRRHAEACPTARDLAAQPLQSGHHSDGVLERVASLMQQADMRLASMYGYGNGERTAVRIQTPLVGSGVSISMPPVPRRFDAARNPEPTLPSGLLIWHKDRTHAAIERHAQTMQHDSGVQHGCQIDLHIRRPAAEECFPSKDRCALSRRRGGHYEPGKLLEVRHSANED